MGSRRVRERAAATPASCDEVATRRDLLQHSIMLRWGIGMVAALLTTDCGGRATDGALAELQWPPPESSPGFPPRPARPTSGGEPPSTDQPVQIIPPRPVDGMPMALPPRITEREWAYARDQVKEILARHCGSCHGRSDVDGPPGELEFIDDFDRMVELGIIVPLRSDRSPLIEVMLDGSMPPPGVAPRPLRGNIDAIAQFIDNPRFWPVITPGENADAGPAPFPVDAGTDGGS
jgi:mono/diheme cytochrome c family protein